MKYCAGCLGSNTLAGMFWQKGIQQLRLWFVEELPQAGHADGNVGVIVPDQP